MVDRRSEATKLLRKKKAWENDKVLCVFYCTYIKNCMHEMQDKKQSRS